MDLTATNNQKWLQDAVDRPVFIVGTMRSGTSFLGLALNQADTMHGCPFELRRVWSRAGRVPMASDVVDNVCPCLGKNDVWPGQADSLKTAFQNEIIRNLGDKKLHPQSRFLNKCPHLCNKLGLVDVLFPEATYIWTVRSLKDVVISLKNLLLRPYFSDNDYFHVWPHPAPDSGARCFSVYALNDVEQQDRHRMFPGGRVSYLAEYWLESNLAVADNLLTKPKHQRLAVLHHDVLERPQYVARRLEQTLELQEGQCNAVIDDSDARSTQRWDHSLSNKEVEQLDDFAAQHRDQINRVFDVAEQLR